MPGRRRGEDGAFEEISFETGRCSLGAILVASSESGVVSIRMGDDPEQLMRELEGQFPSAHLMTGSRADKQILKQIIAHIEKPGTVLDVPLDIRGAAFQKRVWRAVREIPLGQTLTYTEVARKIGSPKAIRAVGNACSGNNLSFAIPCHRVVRSDGSVSGSRHRLLLEREGVAEVKLSGKARKKAGG